MLLELSTNLWVPIKDGNALALTLFNRHYSKRHYKDKRVTNRFVGPGERIVLMTQDALAMFVWKKFIDASGQDGINCAIFRNEGPYLSSTLILEAEKYAADKWPQERMYTYVDGKKIKSTNPGYCFKMAGWKECGRTKKRGLIILEKNSYAVNDLYSRNN